MKLTGQAFGAAKIFISNCRDWLVLQGLLRTRYAPHLDRPQFSDLIDLVEECKEILAGMIKMVERKAAEVVEYLEPEMNDKPGSEIVTELALL